MNRYFTASQARRILKREFPCASAEQIEKAIEALPRVDITKPHIPDDALEAFVLEQRRLFNYQGTDNMGGCR